MVAVDEVLDGVDICAGGNKKFAYVEMAFKASFMQRSEVAAKHWN